MADENKTLSTNDIFEKIVNNEDINRDEINFILPEQVKEQLKNDMIISGHSINSLSFYCDISTSHFCDFLNGKKNLSRDKFLSVLIALKYDIPTIQQMLLRLGYSSLYTRNLRDYILLTNIKKGLNLDEINECLKKENLDEL